ncbi:acyl-CoA dehydrogenase [Aeromicrobium phragmitis]|uniref:Acyl-CoA dehydrogenase n=1 Tax=Aeromicrobium phragmitis TaxID=2478914 RepID=A0A3L8PK98_9ACTN|nr:acyl-CoA dehydrogenase [Aeromicrobium phragmitis]RLV55660.1 acyl-CoA dehydrogenase [Aeromicrobium phragmitis]
MTDQYVSRQDLDFLIEDWLETSALTLRPRFAEHSVETFRGALDLAAELAVAKFAPHNRTADTQEPCLRDDGTVRLIPEVQVALEAYFASGLHSAPFPEAVGGADLPMTIRTGVGLWFAATNCSTSGYANLTAAAANLLLAHGSTDVINRFARPLIAGRFFGTMCLSETQAGSSLADITTRATRQSDGTYRIHGDKMWISAGDHQMGENIVHLVLARTDRIESGIRGTSLFAVPKYLVGEDGAVGERNDVTLVGLNHKMGNRGTTNTVLSFGSGDHEPGGRPGAVGHLVGEENRGIFHMFHMMNEMRIAVGLSAVGLGSAGYLASLEYARTRRQGRRAPSSEPVPIIEHPDVRRMLLAQKSYVEGGLALVLYCGRLMDDAATEQTAARREDAAALLDLLTPVAKSFPAQWCLVANDLAIQVHGGYGYTRDYPVEQHYRDNRLNLIHEGTHGIQAADLLGRKVRARDGATLARLTELMRSTIGRARNSSSERKQLGAELLRRVERLETTTAAIWQDDDVADPLANATIYLEAFGHVVVAWLWLEQHIATQNRDTDFHSGKRLAARYFFEYELPRTDSQWDVLAQRNTLLQDVEPTWL